MHYQFDFEAGNWYFSTWTFVIYWNKPSHIWLRVEDESSFLLALLSVDTFNIIEIRSADL